MLAKGLFYYGLKSCVRFSLASAGFDFHLADINRSQAHIHFSERMIEEPVYSTVQHNPEEQKILKIGVKRLNSLHTGENIRHTHTHIKKYTNRKICIIQLQIYEK